MCKRSKRSNVSKSWLLGTESFLTIVLKFCILLLSFDLAVSVGTYCTVPDTRISFGQRENLSEGGCVAVDPVCGACLNLTNRRKNLA